jgi:hypothetical protein
MMTDFSFQFRDDDILTDAADQLHEAYLSNIEYMAQAGLASSLYEGQALDVHLESVADEYESVNSEVADVVGGTLNYEPDAIWHALFDASV